MKKSELKKIIREEIQKLVKESVSIAGGVISTLRKDLQSKDRKIADAAAKLHGEFSAKDAYSTRQFTSLIPALKVYVKNRKTNEAILREGQYSNLKIYQFVPLIKNDWEKVNYAAKPYLDAMRSLKTLDDKYILDPGSSIVAYFLGNAASWKGPVARDVKKELNIRLKKYYKKSGV